MCHYGILKGETQNDLVSRKVASVGELLEDKFSKNYLSIGSVRKRMKSRLKFAWDWDWDEAIRK